MHRLARDDLDRLVGDRTPGVVGDTPAHARVEGDRDWRLQLEAGPLRAAGRRVGDGDLARGQRRGVAIDGDLEAHGRAAFDVDAEAPVRTSRRRRRAVVVEPDRGHERVQSALVLVDHLSIDALRLSDRPVAVPRREVVDFCGPGLPARAVGGELHRARARRLHPHGGALIELPQGDDLADVESLLRIVGQDELDRRGLPGRQVDLLAGLLQLIGSEAERLELDHLAARVDRSLERPGKAHHVAGARIGFRHH